MTGGGASSHHTPGSPGASAAYIPPSPAYNPTGAYQGNQMIPGLPANAGVPLPGRAAGAYPSGSPIDDSSPSNSPIGDPNQGQNQSPMSDESDADQQ